QGTISDLGPSGKVKVVEAVEKNVVQLRLGGEDQDQLAAVTRDYWDWGTMDFLQDSRWTMQGLNSRLKGFLEQVNKLQEDNRRLEDQIADWGLRNAPHPQESTQQERTVEELHFQVGKLLMENAELALQSDHMKSKASTIQARENKMRVEHTNVQLDAELHHSMTELQDMHQDYMRGRRMAQGWSSPSSSTESGRSATASASPAQIKSQMTDTAAWPPAHIKLHAPLPGLAFSEPHSDPEPTEDLSHREARAELADARKQWHCLQVEIESLHALEKGLESSLHHTQRQYSSQLQGLSQVIQGLEGELEQVRGGLATQRERHGQLLNTKMRLEREIANYRRLLEREEGRYPGGHNGQVMGLRRWRGPIREPDPIGEEPKENGVEENGLSDPTVTPEEPLSEPLPERPQRWTDRIDKVIKQWEGSFFKGNPKLRKKSVSLRFDLHMAAADEGCAQTKQDSLPDVEVRLVMKRSRSIPTIAANVEATV
ncbi:unnamed protein product, partial [Coregonus sp. 'balchen']